MSKVYNMVGLGAPLDNLTAKPEDVTAGKEFVGAAGETQTGALPVVTAKNVVLDTATTSHTVERGRHDGHGTVKVKLQEKRVTPSYDQQTVEPDSGYLLRRVIVESAASFGKQVYTGTYHHLAPYVYTPEPIDTGITLGENDIFFFLPQFDGEVDIGAAASVAVRLSASDQFYFYQSVTPDGTDQLIGQVNGQCVVFSGSTVTVSGVFVSYGNTYKWILIK